MKNYPHEVVRLQGKLRELIPAFLEVSCRCACRCGAPPLPPPGLPRRRRRSLAGGGDGGLGRGEEGYGRGGACSPSHSPCRRLSMPALQENHVEIMVVPDHWPQSMLQLTSGATHLALGSCLPACWLAAG